MKKDLLSQALCRSQEISRYPLCWMVGRGVQLEQQARHPVRQDMPCEVAAVIADHVLAAKIFSSHASITLTAGSGFT